MSKLIVLSGKAASGKTSLGHFITGLVLASNGVCERFKVLDDARLWVSNLNDEWQQEGFIIDMFANYQGQTALFFSEEIFPYIKLYSFADPLKEFCMNVLGCTWEGMYGTNEQKNQLVEHIRWENFPADCNEGKTGPMTNREIMQIFGTNVVRRIYGPAWAKAGIKKVLKEVPEIGVFVDGRFPDEIEETSSVGGTTVRLTRNPINSNHNSETALDNYDKFDFIIDNRELELHESCHCMQRILGEIGVIV